MSNGLRYVSVSCLCPPLPLFSSSFSVRSRPSMRGSPASAHANTISTSASKITLWAPVCELRCCWTWARRSLTALLTDRESALLRISSRLDLARLRHRPSPHCCALLFWTQLDYKGDAPKHRNAGRKHRHRPRTSQRGRESAARTANGSAALATPTESCGAAPPSPWPSQCAALLRARNRLLRSFVRRRACASRCGAGCVALLSGPSCALACWLSVVCTGIVARHGHGWLSIATDGSVASLR